MINMIYARTTGYGIAKDNKIPWDIQEDKEFFSSCIEDSTIVVGRKTYEAMGKRLLNSCKEVWLVSSSDSVLTDNTKVFSSLDELTCRVISARYGNIWICGGVDIYDHFSKLSHILDNIYVTVVKGDIDTDLYLPLNDEFTMLENSKLTNICILENTDKCIIKKCVRSKQ